MNATKTQHAWAAFLKFYTEQNKDKKTRLGVFENVGEVVNDYWIEDGLPLSGIDIDLRGELPAIEILLGSYSHPVTGALRLTIHYSPKGDEDGLDIIGIDGKTTVLRFENA